MTLGDACFLIAVGDTVLIAPGTPSPVRVYTPTSTATASVLSNPLFLAAGLVAVVLLMKGRR